MRQGLTQVLAHVVAAARAQGRDALLEPEGLALAGALGLGVPRHALASGPDGLPDLADFAGDRVVLKVVSPRILHKTDVGGVRVVARERTAVEAALREMRERFAGRDVEGFLVEEFVPHDPSFGGELLFGMRRTDDFGPVVTLGPGGVHAEFLAANLAAGRGAAVLSPALRGAAHVDAALAESAVASLLTNPQRGQPPRVRGEDLREILGRMLELAAAAEREGLAEFETNPVVVTARGLVALDALGKLGPPPAPPAPARPLDKIARLLRPRSVAVAGVSRETNPGRVILRNILDDGFDPSSVLVVKPGAESVDGCRCVPDVASLPGTVDLLVLAVDARQAAAAAEDAIRLRKAESLILIPGGMGERAGSDVHADRVRRALEAARAEPWRGPVVNGANCLGVRSVPGRYNTLFIPRHKLRFSSAAESPLAVLSQSGAFAVSWASKLGPLNPRYVVTMGNQLDLTAGDYLAHLAEDPGVRVFACYVEGFRPRDGDRWLETASRIVEGGRAVLLYRAGRTAAGARAMASHTASIAGDYAVCRALARSAGVVVADTLADFSDMTRLFCLLADKDVAGMRLGAVSNAGFECVAMADSSGPFTPAAFSEATRARLGAILDRARLGAIVGVQNPLDVTPILGDEGFADAAAAVLDDEGVDVGVVGCVPLSGVLDTMAAGPGHGEDLRREGSVVQRLARLASSSRKAWVCVVDAGPDFDAMAAALDAAGVPTFRTADRALALFARYCERRLRRPGVGAGR